MSARVKKTAPQIVGLGGAFVGMVPYPPQGFVVTTEKGLAGMFPLADYFGAPDEKTVTIALLAEHNAIALAKQILASPPQRGNFQRFVKVVKSTQQGGSQLLGQWLWSNYAWCHQGGPWTLGVANCTGVMPPKPTYPAYGRGR